MFRERSQIDTTDVTTRRVTAARKLVFLHALQHAQLNSPSAFLSAELMKMLENQKKEIKELQDALKASVRSIPLAG